MEKIKEIKRKYWAPTPEKWRKIGDTMQDLSILAGGIVALFASPPIWLPVLIVSIGRIGKIITNFNE